MDHNIRILLVHPINCGLWSYHYVKSICKTNSFCLRLAFVFLKAEYRITGTMFWCLQVEVFQLQPVYHILQKTPANIIYFSKFKRRLDEWKIQWNSTRYLHVHVHVRHLTSSQLLFRTQQLHIISPFPFATKNTAVPLHGLHRGLYTQWMPSSNYVTPKEDNDKLNSKWSAVSDFRFSAKNSVICLS